MKQIVLAVGAAAVLAMPAHADWRYLILNEPLDQPVREQPAQPMLPASRGDHRVDAVLDIVMNGGLRGQAEVIMTENDDILVSGEGARLAGLGFGPGDAVPELGFFYPVDELRPAVRAQIQGNQLLMQTGVDTALHRTPGISRSESRPALAPIPDRAPGFQTQPLAVAPAPAPAAPTLALEPELDAAPPPVTRRHQLPWPEVLSTPMPSSGASRTYRQAEVMVSVDGQPRGVLIAALGPDNKPQLAPEDLQALRLPVPAEAVDRGFAVPEDLTQTYSTQYDPAALELRLSTRSPDRWYLAEDDRDEATCTEHGPRRSGPGMRRRDC